VCLIYKYDIPERNLKSPTGLLSDNGDKEEKTWSSFR
jgi:hypothetical protein